MDNPNSAAEIGRVGYLLSVANSLIYRSNQSGARPAPDLAERLRAIALLIELLPGTRE
jgi:hypothetical protein